MLLRPLLGRYFGTGTHAPGIRPRTGEHQTDRLRRCRLFQRTHPQANEGRRRSHSPITRPLALAQSQGGKISIRTLSVPVPNHQGIQFLSTAGGTRSTAVVAIFRATSRLRERVDVPERSQTAHQGRDRVLALAGRTDGPHHSHGLLVQQFNVQGGRKFVCVLDNGLANGHLQSTHQRHSTAADQFSTGRTAQDTYGHIIGRLLGTFDDHLQTTRLRH